MNGLQARARLPLGVAAIAAIAALLMQAAAGPAQSAPATPVAALARQAEAAIPSVPTLSQWGILLLLVGVLGVGLWALSSRRRDHGGDS